MKDLSNLFSSTQINRRKPQSKAIKIPNTGNPPLPFEAIIMAGGKGERLLPLTEDTPKPLLKVGDHPIVEYAVRRLEKAGVRHFTFCLNYMGEKIEAHFGKGNDKGASFEYLYEKEPLGTVGGVSLKENFRFEDLLIINGDLLTTINFEKFYLHYLEEDADIAVATIPYRINLPYGIFELTEQNTVESIREKPSFTYYINTGIYFVKRKVLDLIPRGEKFDAIDLIQMAKERNYKVSGFPLLEYWIDIGQMDDYEKAQKDIQFLDL